MQNDEPRLTWTALKHWTDFDLREPSPGLEILVERLRQLSASFRFEVFGDFEVLFVPGVSVKYFRAFAVKVAAKQLPVFPFSGLSKGC